MPSPLALLLHGNASAREQARQALVRAGVEVIAVATAEEAADVLRSRPHAVVVAMPDGDHDAERVASLAVLCRLKAGDRSVPASAQPDGRSQAAEALRRRLRELASSPVPALFEGEKGSGRSYAARSLHALSGESGPFVVVPAADAEALDAVFKAQSGTTFLPSLELAPWPAQEKLAARLSAGGTAMRVLASTAIDPRKAADEGLLLPALVAQFSKGMVRVPSLRERPEDIGILAAAFLAELCLLNALPPMAIANDAKSALEGYAWPGNVRQLRTAIESAVTVAQDGTVRAEDLPEYVKDSTGPVARADRRFRDAKRTVVEAFERAYLEDLLRRHGGNVTGAAEQSGMLRSALQRLLRKHDLHSADFRRRGGPAAFAS